MISIHLLGVPQVLLDQAPLPLVRRKTRALLYYVAAQTQPQPRERLLALFWPDAPRSSAQQVLRTLLHGLRKDLGAALVADDQSLALAPDTWVDAREFEAALARPTIEDPALQAALELYRGEFLEGFSLPDGPDFESWMTVERERFRRLVQRGWARLAAARTARGELPGALAALERALASDPLQEDLQREAMRLDYLTGDRPGAIRRYDQLRRSLDEEMGVPPMSETRTLYDSILNDKVAQPPAPPAPSALPKPGLTRPAQPVVLAQVDLILPFTGREAELAALRAAAAERKLALIEGEPGIGKTRLAAEFLRTAGGVALAGAARELEQALPYQPVIEALRGLLACPEWDRLATGLRAAVPAFWLSQAAALLPELDPTGQPGRASADESRLWEAVYRLLAALAAHQPVTLFLDDLQWADVSTLGLLAYLARQRGQGATLPLTYLATTRPIPPRSPVATFVQGMTREARIVRLAISRLGSPEIVAIARQLSPQYAYPLANWLERTSEGNPYVLAELVRHARENGLLLEGGEVNLNVLSAAPIVPQTVYSLIQSRLERLSEEARRILEAAVASGRTFEFDVVARAAGLSETAALDSLSELRLAGLVHPGEGTRFVFDHSLTMEVASRELGESRHRLLHRRVAEAMQSLYRGSRLEQEAGLIAWHYREGQSPERAAPFALIAARQAARLAAWTEAAAFFEQAAESESPADRFRAWMGLGRARFQAGQSLQAADAFRQALTLAQTDPHAGDWEDASLELGSSYIAQARFDEILRMARRVRETGRPAYFQQAEFLWGTTLSLEGADLAGAVQHLEAAASLCKQEPSRDPALESRIHFELGSIAAQQGDLPRAVALYQQALDLACASTDLATLSWCALAHNNLAYHLLLLGDLAAAEEHARDGLVLAKDRGMLTPLTYLYSTSGEIALAHANLDEAEQDFLQGLELAGRLSMTERVAGLTANLGLVSLRRGDTALAIHRLSTALARAEAAGTHHLAAQIRIWLAPLLPPAEARAALDAARAFASSSERRLLLEQIDQVENKKTAKTN
jgi:DNA-binding SARP family transcriptional activator/Tfp pilus assembly protein PilF